MGFELRWSEKKTSMLTILPRLRAVNELFLLTSRLGQNSWTISFYYVHLKQLGIESLFMMPRWHSRNMESIWISIDCWKVKTNDLKITKHQKVNLEFDHQLNLPRLLFSTCYYYPSQKSLSHRIWNALQLLMIAEHDVLACSDVNDISGCGPIWCINYKLDRLGNW